MLSPLPIESISTKPSQTYVMAPTLHHHSPWSQLWEVPPDACWLVLVDRLVLVQRQTARASTQFWLTGLRKVLMYAGYAGRREQTGGSFVHSTMFVVISITALIIVRRPILVNIPTQLLLYP